jgi:hypothetical protein
VLILTEKSQASQVDTQFLSCVPFDKGFHFFQGSYHYLGETAISLLTFEYDLEKIDKESIRYHFERGDFQRWIREVIGDGALAERIDRVSAQTSDENLQRQLVEVVKTRLAELKRT